MQRLVMELYADIARHIPTEISDCPAEYQREPITLCRRGVHCSYGQPANSTNKHSVARRCPTPM